MNTFRMCSISSALIVLAGCANMRGGTSDPAAAAEKESRAENKLCDEMAKGNEAIRAFPSVDSETLLSAVQEANEKVGNAVEEVREAGDDVNNPGIIDVQAAYTELQNTVNEVPGGRNTVGDAAIRIDSNAQILQSAWNTLYRDLQCGA